MTHLGPNAHLVGRPGSRAELMTPALLIDLDALECSIAKMADFCRFHGAALRPHAKTHKSVTVQANAMVIELEETLESAKRN